MSKDAKVDLAGGDPARIPVVVGVGQINDRPAPGQDGLDSLELMAAAARAADQDAGGGLLARVDWLTIVPQLSFDELDVPTLLPQSLGVRPAKVTQARIASGDTPVLFLNDCANAISRGEASACLLVGGEALRTAAQRTAAVRTGTGGGLFKTAVGNASELRRRYGLINPAEIYPLYENASRAAWGQTLDEGQAETGVIWALMSEVAADAEGAWIKAPKTPGEIVETNAGNRPISFPYNKFMVANASVNQGAAVIVCSLAVAREAGVPEGSLVYVGAGAAAHEAHDPLERASWSESAGMRTSLERTLDFNGLAAGDLDHVELYSCFPCVPKMARRVLGWPAERPVTVHGGLTFGGGPIGNYMTHAAVAMVQALRKGGRHGLLFANGGHCTHNHCIVLSRTPPDAGRLPKDYDVQAEADAARGPIRELGDAYEGPVTVETYTVIYDRAGAPDYGVVLARAPDGARVIARVDGADAATIEFLTDGKVEPVGSRGVTARSGESLHWRPGA